MSYKYIHIATACAVAYDAYQETEEDDVALLGTYIKSKAALYKNSGRLDALVTLHLLYPHVTLDKTEYAILDADRGIVIVDKYRDYFKKGPMGNIIDKR